MHVSIDVAWVGLRLWQKDGSVPRVTADDMSMMHVSIDVAWVGLRLWQKDGSGAHFTVLIIFSLELARAVLRRRAELAGWAYVEYPSPKPWSLQRIPASPRQFRHWDKACSQTLLPDLQFLLAPMTLLQVMRRTHEWDAQRHPFGLGLILRTTILALFSF